MYLDGWADNHGVRLHYLETGTASCSLPLVFLPGTFGYAEDYIDEMSALAPRRCMAVSLRGRGRSDTPAVGYSSTRPMPAAATAPPASSTISRCTCSALTWLLPAGHSQARNASVEP